MDSLPSAWPSPAVLALGRVRPQGGAQVCVLLGHLTLGGSAFDAVVERMLARVRPLTGQTLVVAGLSDFAISVAAAAPARGFKICVVAPESLSSERRELLRAAAVQTTWVPAGTPLAQMWRRARSVARESGGRVVWPRRVDVREAVGTALADAFRDGPAAFACGAGTGKTFVGCLDALAARPGAWRPHAVLLHAGGPHHVQGWGTLASLGRRVLGRADEVLKVDEADAWRMRERLAREEGLLLSMSSAANVAGAYEIARRLPVSARVATVAWSSGERDFSVEGVFR